MYEERARRESRRGHAIRERSWFRVRIRSSFLFDLLTFRFQSFHFFFLFLRFFRFLLSFLLFYLFSSIFCFFLYFLLLFLFFHLPLPPSFLLFFDLSPPSILSSHFYFFNFITSFLCFSETFLLWVATVKRKQLSESRHQYQHYQLLYKVLLTDNRPLT